MLTFLKAWLKLKVLKKLILNPHPCCTEASNISAEIKSTREVEAPIQEDDDEVIVMPGITISQDTVSEHSSPGSLEKKAADTSDTLPAIPPPTVMPQPEKRTFPHYTKVYFFQIITSAFQLRRHDPLNSTSSHTFSE